MAVRPRDAGVRDRFAAIDDALARPGAPRSRHGPSRLGEALDPETLAGAAVPGWGRSLGAEERAGAGLAERSGRGSRRRRPTGCCAPPAGHGRRGAGAAGAVARWWPATATASRPSAAPTWCARGSPGARDRAALAEVRAALLDGRVAGPEEQLALALRVAREGR